MRRLFQFPTVLIVMLAFAIFKLYANNHVNSNGSEQEKQALINSMPATKHVSRIVLGSGCFWGAEKRYQALDGVINAVSGYADGRGIRASYREITQAKNRYNKNNHAEVVEVSFDPAKISVEELLKFYFEQHDPTQKNGQGNDIGTQYRSTILTTNEQHLAIAKTIKAEYQALLSAQGYGKIATKIKPLKRFYPAEDYHQDYLLKNPNGYCPDHSTGVKFTHDMAKTDAKIIDNSALEKGKQILVIESEGYCAYCEKFKKDVADAYKGSIPLSYRLPSQLQGLDIKSPTWATPTIIFLQDGKEVYAKQGYMNAKQFYSKLGQFKLGQSEAYNVAFNASTDGRFCKQYKIFKNTPDGVFVDKLSGAALFDTKDRFDSGSGWLSFTKPVDGSVYELQDNSHGMKRVEIRSKGSDIHLGHVFDDGPKGQLRYCINATVLEFVARSEYQK